MFKWPSQPPPSASREELADFVELVCWQQGHMSGTALSRALGRLSENDYSDGVPEDEEVSLNAEQAFEEIERRQAVCQVGYPFRVIGSELTLRHAHDANKPEHVIYKYLLLSTRLNMVTSRIHAGHDGTLLLEELSADVAKTYFGERAESLVFGTAEGGIGFTEKIENLCRRLGEGGGFQDLRSPRRRARDEKLDVVAWKPFADGLAGKLIGFGQCKTGTHYRDSLTQLRPDGFILKWMREPLTVLPIRMFFISEALAMTSNERYEDLIDAGLLFDRCRIIDFCDGVGEELLTTLREWTEAAAVANELPAFS